MEIQTAALIILLKREGGQEDMIAGLYLLCYLKDMNLPAYPRQGVTIDIAKCPDKREQRAGWRYVVCRLQRK